MVRTNLDQLHPAPDSLLLALLPVKTKLSPSVIGLFVLGALLLASVCFLFIRGSGHNQTKANAPLQPDPSGWSTRLSQLPDNLREFLLNRFGSENFTDDPAKFSPTDVIMAPRVALHLLLRAKKNADHWFVHSENGGIVHNSTVMVIRVVGQKYEEVELIYVPRNLKSAEELATFLPKPISSP